MPSFDIVNRVDPQEVANSVNNTLKEVRSRYDFRGTHTEISYDKKSNSIHLVAGDNMKINAVREMLIRHAIKRGVSPKLFTFSDMEGTSKGNVKMEIALQEGIDHETAKKIVQEIKGLNLKVQPAIQQDHIRVTGKKIDDLQTIITHLKRRDLPIPLQFVNMK
ncbi:MAG: YajQ family cyclic di-GMP-binding protein [Balneolaceae bacterium]|nr:YajQ family cyclic di-GMP-binding protein [Balneolaceae bacterium]